LEEQLDALADERFVINYQDVSGPYGARIHNLPREQTPRQFATGAVPQYPC
jgi:hypothetical protein